MSTCAADSRAPFRTIGVGFAAGDGQQSGSGARPRAPPRVEDAKCQNSGTAVKHCPDLPAREGRNIFADDYQEEKTSYGYVLGEKVVGDNLPEKDVRGDLHAETNPNMRGVSELPSNTLPNSSTVFTRNLRKRVERPSLLAAKPRFHS